MVTQTIKPRSRPGHGGPPTVVYGIVVSLFVLFKTFALNMVYRP